MDDPDEKQSLWREARLLALEALYPDDCKNPQTPIECGFSLVSVLGPYPHLELWIGESGARQLLVEIKQEAFYQQLLRQNRLRVSCPDDLRQRRATYGRDGAAQRKTRDWRPLIEEVKRERAGKSGSTVSAAVRIVSKRHKLSGHASTRPTGETKTLLNHCTNKG